MTPENSSAFSDGRESRSHRQSFPQVKRGSMGSLSLFGSVAHDYWNNKKLSSILLQSLTGSFICIQWLRKLPAELHVLDGCLEQVRVICPLVYSSLFITAQRWPMDTPSLSPKHPERDFSHSSQSPKYYSSLNSSFQWRWSPRATGSTLDESRFGWNTWARTSVASWSQ